MTKIFITNEEFKKLSSNIAEKELLEKYTIMWKHEDPNDCDHGDYMEDIGKMQSDDIDGVYNIPFFCPNCNYFVKEVYNYEGVEIA